MKKLPWSTKEYRYLEPGDLQPCAAPTPEQRIRLAAAVATHIRDEKMLGREPSFNAEAIRAMLTGSADAWARDSPDAAAAFASKGIVSYDVEDPKIRFEQTIRALKS